MKISRLSVICFLAAGAALAMQAVAAPSFTITATNVTMPKTGLGFSDYTLRSIDGYTGNVSVVCNILDPPSPNIKVPTCTYGPVKSISLGANQIVTGKVNFYPPNYVVPVVAGRGPTTNPGRKAVQICGIALAGFALFGLARRRRALRWLALAAVSVVGLAGISACGGNGSTMTPGTYVYVVSAVDISTSKVDGTHIQVTIP